MYIPFEELPESARIWIYTAQRALNPSEQDLIQKELISFINAWQSHQVEVKASFIIKEARFIIIGSDESAHDISGCGIDKSVGQLRDLEEKLHVKLLDKSLVYFQLEGQPVPIPFQEIKNQVYLGRIGASTPFYNTLLSEKWQLESQFKIRTDEGWVKKHLASAVSSNFNRLE